MKKANQGIKLLFGGGVLIAGGLIGCAFEVDESLTPDVETRSQELVACTVPPVCPDVQDIYACETAWWHNGTVYYRFVSGSSTVQINAIEAAMADWETATLGVVRFQKDLVKPTNQVVTIHTQTGGGVVYGSGPGATAYMGADSAYHELAHVLGISHTFKRRDGRHYSRVNQTSWVTAGGYCTQFSRCSDPDGDFGPHHYRSTTGYKPSYPDITRWDTSPLMGSLTECGDQPSTVPAVPLWFSRACTTCASASPDALTPNDAAQVVEMYTVGSGGWDKFRRVHNESDVASDQPFPSFITGSVSIVGSPATTVFYGLPHVFVRGSDNQIYHRNRITSPQAGWNSWSVLTNGTFSSDPAVVSRGTDRIELVAKGMDNNIYLRTYGGGGWGNGYASLGSPSGGAASSPAITSWGTGRLDVFVRGTDNKLYVKTCATTGTNCGATSGNWSGWSLVSSSATFRGKPAVTSAGNTIYVFVHGGDARLWGTQYTSGGSWTPFYQLAVTGTLGWHSYEALAGSCSSDDCYSPAAMAHANGIDIVFRGGDSKAWFTSYTTGGTWSTNKPIGGMLSSSPALPTKALSSRTLHLFATMDEERTMDQFVSTLWWKKFPFPI